MLFYAAALQTLNYDWDTLEHDANTQTAVEEHEASIQSAMAEIKVLVRRIAFALNVLRRGE